jgi:molecular chaperone GrpE (heat shock protein)
MNVLADRLEEYRRFSREDHQKLADHNATKRTGTTKEILDRLDAMERGLHQRVNEQTKRINTLENWRYYMMGMGGVLLLLVARINWPSLFG